MNKRFLAIAIAAGLAVSSNVMADGAEIYGVAHVSVNSISADSGASAIDATTVSSNNSRLGVKGSEDLGGGLKAVYKMEFGVDLADKAGDACDNDPGCDTFAKTFANGNLIARNQYVGLSGGMGTVLLGRHDSPTKMVQGKFDIFNDTIADMKQVVDGEIRYDNSVTYFSPKMGGMQMIAQLLPGEGLYSGAGCTPCDGIADGASLSFTYEAGPLYVGLGIDTGDLVADDMRLIATYNMDALAVGFIYNTRSDSAYSATDLVNDEKAMGLSAKYAMGDNAVKLQYIQVSDQSGIANNDATATTLGYDMNLSARTTAYALYNMYSPDASNTDITTMSVGISHSF